MTATAWERTDTYLTALLCPVDDDLELARSATLDAGLPDIAVSALQGQQIALIARMVGARRILEIGCLGGYSTLWLAKTLPPDGRMVTIDNNPLHAAAASSAIDSAGLADRVEVRVGNGAAVLAELATAHETFDLFFVDADQHNNVAYLEGCLRMARSGSVFVLDNVVRRGEISDDLVQNPALAATREVLDVVGSSSSVDATVFQTVGVRGHDGMLVVRVR